MYLDMEVSDAFLSSMEVPKQQCKEMERLVPALQDNGCS